jgi:small multidrug resistance pump
MDSRGPVARLRLQSIAVLVNMSRFIQVVFARSGCALILGGAGSLIGLVTWAVEAAQSVYPRSPSSIVWAAVGVALVALIGALFLGDGLTKVQVGGLVLVIAGVTALQLGAAHP